MDPDLTLEKGKKTIHQREAVHEQQTLLQKEFLPNEQSSVEAMRTRQRQHKPAGKAKRPIVGSSKCSRCGEGQHSRDKCPARDAICHKCKKEPITALSVTANLSPV